MNYLEKSYLFAQVFLEDYSKIIPILLSRSYADSLIAYSMNCRKSSLNTPKLPCKEITHLTVMERETASAISESQDRQEVAEYYDRRYEPLQREVIDACTKRIKLKKGIVNEEQLNQLMNYDPLRKDSFLTSGHGSSYSDGVRIFIFHLTIVTGCYGFMCPSELKNRYVSLRQPGILKFKVKTFESGN